MRADARGAWSGHDVRVTLLTPEGREALRTAVQRVPRRAVQDLMARADAALEAEPPTVTKKTLIPPTGSKHDYMSLAIYFWPNPDTPDGLPYVARDGQVNPEVEDYDRPRMLAMHAAVETLTLAWRLTGKEGYARKAGELLRAWFLGRPTHMNPNMLCAQYIPGGDRAVTPLPTRRVEGPGGDAVYVAYGGVIEGCSLPALLDTVGLLAESGRLTADDMAGLRDWFHRFLYWLLSHQHGQDEATAPNNHASWFCAQAGAYALFAGEEEVARNILGSRVQERIRIQIEPDGSQPHELGRATSFKYTCFGLASFFNCALMAERVGVDLWNWQTADGRSLRRALDWLMPYLAGQPWPYRTLGALDYSAAAPLLHMAARAWKDPAYTDALRHLPDYPEDHRYRLLYPAAG